MNDFDEKLREFNKDFHELKKLEAELRMKAEMVNGRFQAWLKEIGAPDPFSLTELMVLALNKRAG